MPPPLSIDNSDGGVNAPPAITDLVDTSGTSRRPPDTLAIEVGALQELRVTVVDVDLTDDIVLQLFVDYDKTKHDADVNCPAPQTMPPSSTRVANCTTSNLCPIGSEGGHTLEVEAYDRDPEPNFPYRTPTSPGYFATWTFHLECSPAS